jgi:DNA-binding CsgD family transcriptional regulator
LTDIHGTEPRSFSPRENSSAPASRQITDRQLECLAWVQEGKSASDIGGILGLSSRTVEGHLIKICSHLGVRTRVQAVLKARDLGLLVGTAP